MFFVVVVSGHIEMSDPMKHVSQGCSGEDLASRPFTRDGLATAGRQDTRAKWRPSRVLRCSAHTRAKQECNMHMNEEQVESTGESEAPTASTRCYFARVPEAGKVAWTETIDGVRVREPHISWRRRGVDGRERQCVRA